MLSVSFLPNSLFLWIRSVLSLGLEGVAFCRHPVRFSSANFEVTWSRCPRGSLCGLHAPSSYGWVTVGANSVVCRAVPWHSCLLGSATTPSGMLVSRAVPHPVWGPATAAVGWESVGGGSQHNWLQGPAVTAVFHWWGSQASCVADCEVQLLWVLKYMQDSGCLLGVWLWCRLRPSGCGRGREPLKGSWPVGHLGWTSWC